MSEACVLCGTYVSGMCLSCFRELQLQRIDRYISHACNQCGYPLFERGDFCPFCAKESDLPHTQRMFLFHGAVKELLELYTHTRERKLIPLFAHLLYKQLVNSRRTSDMLIPIPDVRHTGGMHQSDRMHVICRYIAKTYGLAVCEALVCQKHNRGLLSDNHEGLHHTHGFTFRLRKSRIQRLKGQSLCVIDDIIVTGSTLKAAQSALRLAEPKEISALVLAMD